MRVTITDEQLENIHLSTEVQQKALENAKEGYVMTLLEAGAITSGRAGRILGIPRLDVLERMKKWNISPFDDSQDLEALAKEVQQAEAMLNQRRGDRPILSHQGDRDI